MSQFLKTTGKCGPRGPTENHLAFQDQTDQIR